MCGCRDAAVCVCVCVCVCVLKRSRHCHTRSHLSLHRPLPISRAPPSAAESSGFRPAPAALSLPAGQVLGSVSAPLATALPLRLAALELAHAGACHSPAQAALLGPSALCQGQCSLLLGEAGEANDILDS